MIRILFKATVPDEEIIRSLPGFIEQEVRPPYKGRRFRRGRIRVSFHHGPKATVVRISTDYINMHRRIAELLTLAKTFCQLDVAEIKLAGGYFSQESIQNVGGFGDVPVLGLRRTRRRGVILQ